MDENEKRAIYTVATTWHISMEKVRETQGANELLTLCAFLAPNAIPLDIIGSILERLEESNFWERVYDETNSRISLSHK